MKKLLPHFDLSGISPDRLQELCQELLRSNVIMTDYIRTTSKTREVQSVHDTSIFLIAHEFLPAHLEHYKK